MFASWPFFPRFFGRKAFEAADPDILVADAAHHASVQAIGGAGQPGLSRPAVGGRPLGPAHNCAPWMSSSDAWPLTAG